MPRVRAANYRSTAKIGLRSCIDAPPDRFGQTAESKSMRGRLLYVSSPRPATRGKALEIFGVREAKPSTGCEASRQ